jgi:hypothetical protein
MRLETIHFQRKAARKTKHLRVSENPGGVQKYFWIILLTSLDKAEPSPLHAFAGLDAVAVIGIDFPGVVDLVR